MDKSGSISTRKTSRLVFRVAVVFTVILALFVRVMGGGWFLILFGLPLLLGAVIHLVVQFIASGARARTGSPSGLWLALSNLLFFFGYALQADGGDSSGGYIGLINVLASLRGLIPWGQVIEFTVDICNRFNNFALLLLVALFATWVIMGVLMASHTPPAPTPGTAPAA